MTAIFNRDILQGKVALVTGGGSGIGFEIAATLAEHGAKVAILGRNVERLQQAANELQGAGHQILTLACDIRDGQQVSEAIVQLLEHWQRLDILVNGAAGNFPAMMKDLSFNGFRTIVDIDLNGTFNVSKVAFDQYMSEHGGSIINISAAIQYTGMAAQAHVASAKAGVDALTRTAAIEWGPHGIRVNGVAPGAIEATEGLKRILPADHEQKAIRRIPMRRMGKGRDIANAVLFLATDAASYVTGTCLVVDGGAWLAAGSEDFYAQG